MDVVLRALTFAAEKHQFQHRKGVTSIPYINHPIMVTRVLWKVGRVRDVEVLTAALLHDVLEDTQTTIEEIHAVAGDAALDLVLEVTDDKSLPKEVRKRLQIKHTAAASTGAKLIKLADKICNVNDLQNDPPAGWTPERINAYLDWSAQVVAQARGTNPYLEAEFDHVLARARSKVMSR
ncbi:MAG: HD domain-containing protein [Anaerolineae bacterium]|nr:HD domain-containing protein [Anaerolineae bacterium]